MHRLNTSMDQKTLPPSLLMEAANDPINLLTFDEWSRDPSNSRLPVVPERVYAGREIGIRQHLYRAWEREQMFVQGEAPVACFGSVAVRSSTTKWHYSMNVLERFMRKHRIFIFKQSQVQELRDYVHRKRRKPWHNFKEALKDVKAGWLLGYPVVWVYGKWLSVTPERYEMMMWLHTEELRLRKLP